MRKSQLSAEALSAWTIKALREGAKSLTRQGLPDLDLRTFFRAFARAEQIPSRISLALVGFDADVRELKAIAVKTGARCFTGFATDLHAAAGWRNKRIENPVIVAYARGPVTGVSTLGHFAPATSRELTLTLLEWAASQPEFTRTPAHVRLLGELQGLVRDEDMIAFEQVRGFLATWSQGSSAGAPRQALPALGLLPDPNLFADATLIRTRLQQNASFVAALRDRTPGQMEAVRKRLARAATHASQKPGARSLLKVFEKLQQIRRDPSPAQLGGVTLDEGLRVFAPLPKPSGTDESPDDHNENDSPETRAINEQRLQQVATGALLDDRVEELAANAATLSTALHSALDGSSEGPHDATWDCSVTVGGEPRSFEGHLDRRFVGWVRHFCRPDVWGGLVETTVPDLRRALEDYDRPDTRTLDPERLIRLRNEDWSITRLLAGWDEELAGNHAGPSLSVLWEKLKALRQALLSSLEELTHFPLEWLAGKPDVAATTKDYLEVSGQLLGVVARNYGAVVQVDPNLARTTVESLLALDVVQARIAQDDGKVSFKAVLLPTHPLHLWRYWRLGRILKGLGRELGAMDRAAVIEEACEPLQFLSVLYASPLPGKRGAGQVLPVANDLYRLATFENLRNAYNGPDGQSALVYGVERFAAVHRHHVSPLRVMVVNPPQAGSLLLDLLKLLDRSRGFIPRLRFEVRGTPQQAARLREALLFDTREREIIEEKLAAGRLELLVNRTPTPLAEILTELRTRPVHLVAIFDEAPVSVRRGGAGERLPMSPFCVRRKVAFHRHWNELRLEPTAGDPPFFEFIELIKHVEGNEGEGTPYAWPEAEELRAAVDDVLTPDEFGAHWFFLADRALPEEGEMRAQRLLRRREGQRQILLAARDYQSLARLMLPVFQEDTPNLIMPVRRLQELLAEGAHLVGAGLLDVVRSQGRVVPAKVTGLMGAMLTARDHARRHPGALLVSTDSQLARTWFRLGPQGERCDLLGLHEEGSSLVVECIEVKTTKGAPRPGSDTEIAHACTQVAATLKAVREGLGDTSQAEAEGRHLAAPRNEMLKEVLVQGCMGRFASTAQRTQWAAWLQRLFGSQPQMPQVRGVVVDVALGSAQDVSMSEIDTDGVRVRVEHLNEMDVQRLLEDAQAASGEEDGGPSAPSLEDSILFEGAPRPPQSVPTPPAQVVPAKDTDADVAEGSQDPVPRDVSKGSSNPSLPLAWPPHENVFGLIGQATAATKLHNKAELASGTGRRFTDTLFIGPAGVGKSSLARAVAKRLLAEEPVFFSGSDLPRPSSLIDKLRELGKAGRAGRGRVRVGRCLVFIDEVHALARPTATVLLSAMDDARIATVGGREYDFSDVVFVAATTDKGLLSDAFVSRMDPIPLAAYTLDELAGIIWYHGSTLLGGFQLQREVCIEVAARNRCNPRRAVRSLENDLLAEFYAALPPKRRREAGAERAAAALMTQESVATYYEKNEIDLNGLDKLAVATLEYLKLHGPTAEDRLCRGLRISNRADFVELAEYLTRLGLLTTGHAGRSLTATGRRYLEQRPNLRDRI